MEPIINPWLIYAVNMCGDFKEMATIGAVFIVFPIVVLGIECTMVVSESDKKLYIKNREVFDWDFLCIAFHSHGYSYQRNLPCDAGCILYNA